MKNTFLLRYSYERCVVKMRGLVLGSAIYSVVASVILFFWSFFSHGESVEIFLRVISGIMIVLGILLLIFARDTSMFAKILLIVAGVLGCILVFYLGVIGGFLGVIAAIILFVSYRESA